MPTMVVLGAGPGLGAAARRFGREGFSPTLVSRAQASVDRIAAFWSLHADRGAFRSFVGVGAA